MVEIVPLRSGFAEESGGAAAFYVLSLRESGQRTMATALRTIGSMLMGFAVTDTMDVPWAKVRFEHASAIRSILQARYATATVNRHLTALRGVMRCVWRMGHITGDELARIVDVPNIKGKSLPAGRMLLRTELASLWEVADCLPLKYGALLSLLFSAGLRREEAARLRWADVTTEVGADGSETWWLAVLHGKGGKQRRVPVRGTAACRLSRLWKEIEAKPSRHRNRVLGVAGGRSVAKMLARLVKAAGIEHCSPHDLRRSFVSHALANGAPIADVARAAGHSDPRTTAGYDRRPDEALVGVADAVSIEQ